MARSPALPENDGPRIVGTAPELWAKEGKGQEGKGQRVAAKEPLDQTTIATDDRRRRAIAVLPASFLQRRCPVRPAAPPGKARGARARAEMEDETRPSAARAARCVRVRACVCLSFFFFLHEKQQFLAAKDRKEKRYRKGIYICTWHIHQKAHAGKEYAAHPHWCGGFDPAGIQKNDGVFWRTPTIQKRWKIEKKNRRCSSKKRQKHNTKDTKDANGNPRHRNHSVRQVTKWSARWN